MRPTDHSVHPFLIPCQAYRSFAALSLACSPHPYSHSPFSQPFLTARHQHLHPPVSRTASLPAVKTHMARTATARTVRCMPGSPHLHIAAFIAPFIAARQTLLPVPDKPRRTPFSIPPLPATPKMAASLPPYPPSPAEHAPNPTAPIRFAHAIF